jgi:hypothetical protein
MNWNLCPGTLGDEFFCQLNLTGIVARDQSDAC